MPCNEEGRRGRGGEKKKGREEREEGEADKTIWFLCMDDHLIPLFSKPDSSFVDSYRLVSQSMETFCSPTLLSQLPQS